MTVPDAESWSLRAPDAATPTTGVSDHDATDRRHVDRDPRRPTAAERARGIVLLTAFVIVVGVLAAAVIGAVGAGVLVTLFRLLTG